jgi:hypothetical protein
MGDPVASTQLGGFAKGTAASLAELRDAANKVNISWITLY